MELLFIIAVTSASSFIGFREMYVLVNDMKHGKYIEGSELHSLAHVGSIGLSVILSIALSISNGTDLIMEIGFFNAYLIFVLFPHFIWERKNN